MPNEVVLARLKRIFDSFLEKSFTGNNNVYFEKLLSHLAAKENSYVVQAQFASEWLIKCIDMIIDDYNAIQPKVISFMLNFASLFASDEWAVITLRENHIMDRVMTIVELYGQHFNPSIKLGSIRLLSAVTHHSLGLAYVRHAKAWRCLVDYCNNDHTLYVVREARQLIYDLMYKFSVKTKDESIVLEMLAAIVKPLVDNVYEDNNDTIHINVDDGELQHKLSATLDLISYIFQRSIEAEEKTNLIHLCNVHFNLEMSVWKATEMTQNPHFMEKIITALTSINFARLVYEKWEPGETIAPENFNAFGLCFFNIMKMCISRGDMLNFLNSAQLNHLLWKRLGQRAPKEIQIEQERVCFENQLITFHILPVLFILKSAYFLQEELFDSFVMKLLQNSCEQTVRTCYAYRDVLYSTEKVQPQHVANLACKSIHGILSMEHKLERDQAVLVAQSMIYALKEFVMKTFQDTAAAACPSAIYTSVVTPCRTTSSLDEMQNVLYSVLVGLQTLIERYRISWKESIETISLVNCVGSLLENPNMSSRLTVQALKLIQLSIEHFLAPNMALLVDNLQGSSLTRLGPLIVKRCHDTAWEVRDSTLELVASIANISRLKYPAFQRLLVDHNMCPLVYEMAKHDAEPYVRASALNCLTQFVSINLIWENALSRLDLIEHLFSVLYNESEGIVRKEAVVTLTKIYDQRKIPAGLQNTFYSTLTHSTVADLHWEVKVYALRFWELEIQKQFTNLGMIDGSFPTVTFSKENKKIVTLNEKEINLRIAKAFHELSQRGCFGVLLLCLQDDCDLEVMRCAVCIVRRLLEMLNKYDYVEAINNGNNMSPSAPAQSHSPPPAMEVANCTTINAVQDDGQAETQQDNVIQAIIDAQDINLLIASYESQMHLNGDATVVEQRQIDAVLFKQYANVSPKHFISTVKSIDFEQLLKKHHEWYLSNESFISLLDDILCAIYPEEAEAIFADCY